MMNFLMRPWHLKGDICAERKNHQNNYVVEKRGLAELKVCHFSLESQLKSQCFN